MSKANQKKVSVILPTYNERENINELIYRIAKTLKKQMSNYEIIVVDDNSPDKMGVAVQKLILKNRNIRFVQRLNEKGLPSAILRGINESRGNIIVWMDCDLSMPPEDIPKLVNALKDCDIAIGSRYVKNGGDIRNLDRALTSRVFNLFAHIVLGVNVQDCDSGFIAIKKNVLKQISFSKNGYGEYFMELIYKAKQKNFKIREIPYVLTERKRGKSKTSGNLFQLLGHGVKYGLKVVKLRYLNR